MKRAKNLFLLCIAFMLVFGSFNVVHASESVAVDEFEYLRAAFELVNSITEEQAEQFKAENEIWIREIGLRLDAYLSTIPAEQHDFVVIRLMGGNPFSRTGNVDEFFTFHTFHPNRGGFPTISVTPTWGVRLWGPTMRSGWNALVAQYPIMRGTSYSSLWMQYECHWHYDAFGWFAGPTWDLEIGRPNVSWLQMTLSRCNP